MAKVRAPLSTQGALARIAGQLPRGWDEMAEIADRATSTCYNWGNPDTPESVPLDCAIRLDLAFQAAGGEGAPLYETYGHQLQLAHVAKFADALQLARRTMVVIREGGQAHEALVAASLPGATDGDRARARREVEEGIVALQSALPLLEAMPDKPP